MLLDNIQTDISIEEFSEKCVKMILQLYNQCLYILQDLFHLQLVKGDLSHNIEKYLPKTGMLLV